MSNIVQSEISGSRSKKRSKVWKQFDEVRKPDGSIWAKCRECGNLLRCDSKKNGTSTLRRHPCFIKIAISSERQENHLSYDGQNSRELSRYQQKHLEFDQYNDHELSENRDLGYDQQRNRQLFVKMVMDNITMLEHVENPFLKEFALSLQPLYSHVDQRTVEKDCLAFYENEKAKLKNKFSKLTSKVSLTCNQSIDGSYFVAANFINNDFELEKQFIGFVPWVWARLEETDILNDWAFGKGVLAITADTFTLNGSKHIHVSCILHYFQSIASEFLDNIYEITAIVRKMTQLDYEQRHNLCRIVSKHNLISKLSFNLYDKQGLGHKFNMLRDACIYKEVICALGNNDIAWDVLEDLFGLLNPINDIVLMLSSSESPTINLLVKCIFQIKDILTKTSPAFECTESTIHKFLDSLKDYLVSCDYVVHFSSLLDPQFKSRFLKEQCNGEGMMLNKGLFLGHFHDLYNTYQYESTEHSNHPKYSMELNNYLESSSVDETIENFDVFGWWKSHESEYPILSRIARDILAIPISCSQTSGKEPLEDILPKIYWSGISIEMINALVYYNNWLRSNCNSENFLASIGNKKEKEQDKTSAHKEIRKLKNNLYGASTSGKTNPEHHVDQTCRMNYEGAKVLAQDNNSAIDPEKCRELLAKMVISSGMSFNLLKNSRFIEWARDLQPMYDPSNVISSEPDCSGLQNIFNNNLNLNKISLSVQNIRNLSCEYLCYTMHYIDDNLNLIRAPICSKDIRFNPDQKIVAEVARSLQNWGLHKKILAITIESCKDDPDLNCGVWETSLQYNVSGFFNVLPANREFIHCKYCITGMIKFLEDPNAMQSFNQLALTHNISPKSDFRSDRDYSWYPMSSTQILHEALPYRVVFEAFDFPPVVRRLSREEWNEVEYFLKLSKPIYKAAIILSSFKYPTSNLLLRIVFEIHDLLSSIKVDDDGLQLVEFLSEHVADFWKGCDRILLIASILDPQFKFAYLERCYKEHVINEREVNKYIEELCSKYEIEVSEKGLGMRELERYREEGHVEIGDDADFDILRWWKDNKANYPIMFRMARDILAIPVSAVWCDLDSCKPKWYKHPKFAKSEYLLGDCINEFLEYNNCKYPASTNNESEQDESASEQEESPPSPECLRQVWDVYSICFLENCLIQRKSEEIVIIEDVGLTAQEMECLIRPIHEDGKDKYIPDDVINCYISIMKNQRATSTNVLMLSTFETRYLQNQGSMKDKTLIETGNSFLQHDLVFFPIHFQDHWFVGVLNGPNREFQILDSLHSVGLPYEELTHDLRSRIQECLEAAYNNNCTANGWRHDILKWRINVVQNLPQQDDRCSCGLFALKYMQFWNGSKLTCEFTQGDIHIFRRRLVGELIFSDLNEKANIKDEIKKMKYSFN